jgi:N-acetylglutamate synthase-like GNAT family acetyltransferase
MISLRAATAADQPAIVALVRAAQINPMDLKWPNFVLAIDGDTGAVVGIGQVKQHRDGSRELASIATAPGYQHRGIAHQVIEHLLAQHPGVLYLTCMDYLEGLYQPFGFRTIGPAEMSPYFQRITRLAKTFLFLSGTGHKLLVMKRDPSHSA